jgi:hypothetical protein
MDWEAVIVVGSGNTSVTRLPSLIASAPGVPSNFSIGGVDHLVNDFLSHVKTGANNRLFALKVDNHPYIEINDTGIPGVQPDTRFEIDKPYYYGNSAYTMFINTCRFDADKVIN